MSASSGASTAPGRPPRRRAGFRLMAGVAILVVRVLRWRIETRGVEHLPGRSGAVIVWNHHGHLDLLPTLWELYRRRRRDVRVLAKRELWDARLVGPIVRAIGAIPVARDSPRERARSLAAAVEALRRGELVAVAPEGTLSRSFEVMELRTGAARMAITAGVPVVPIVSWGSHRAVTSGRGFSLRRAYRLPILVRVGQPLPPAASESPAQLTARLHARMAALLDEVQRSYPDGTPSGAWWVPARLGGGAPVPGGNHRD